MMWVLESGRGWIQGVLEDHCKVSNPQLRLQPQFLPPWKPSWSR